MSNDNVFKMKFTKVYPLFIQKVERKGRTKAEVDEVICWLTGYDEQGLQSQLTADVDFEGFLLNFRPAGCTLASAKPDLRRRNTRCFYALCGTKTQ